MEKFEFKIMNEHGIHARPAGQLVKTANAFDSTINIENKNGIANAKGMFAIMGLNAKQGDTITITCEGSDEKEARKAIESFLRDNFSGDGSGKLNSFNYSSNRR